MWLEDTKQRSTGAEGTSIWNVQKCVSSVELFTFDCKSLKIPRCSSGEETTLHTGGSRPGAHNNALARVGSPHESLAE